MKNVTLFYLLTSPLACQESIILLSTHHSGRRRDLQGEVYNVIMEQLNS